MRTRLIHTGFLIAVGLALGVSPAVRAQQPPPADDLGSRIEKLEKQNQELLEALKKLQSTPTSPVTGFPGGPATNLPTSIGAAEQGLGKDDVHKIVGDYLKTRDDQQKAADAAKKALEAEKGFVVGKSMGMTTTWKGNQPWLETADQAFRVHVGCRLQPDWTWMNAPNNVKNGVGGVGPFFGGVNFRRARLEADGWLWENIDFFCEFDFVNNFSTAAGNGVAVPQNEANTFNAPAPTDVWAGINYLPVLGGFRIGNFKPPIGLNHLISSRYLDFLERDHGFDTYFNRNNGFAPGVMMYNWTENERLTWQLAVMKNNNGLFGWNSGNNDWQYNGRVTWLPWYCDEGRYMMHLGFGAQWNQLDQGQNILRDRVLLRNGPANLHSTVALAILNGQSQTLLNPEFFMNFGPLSVQAEYIASWTDQVTLFRTQVNPGGVAVAPRTFFSQTAYIQAMYFLTGEHRPYGKTALHSSGAAPTRVVPYRNFFWTRGEGCGNPFSAGAWQVGVRYCYTDLNNNGINGGQINEFTFGLNWFLNPNLKIQGNYDIGHRKIPGGTSDGTYYGFGVRMAFDF